MITVRPEMAGEIKKNMRRHLLPATKSCVIKFNISAQIAGRYILCYLKESICKGYSNLRLSVKWWWRHKR